MGGKHRAHAVVQDTHLRQPLVWPVATCNFVEGSSMSLWLRRRPIRLAIQCPNLAIYPQLKFRVESGRKPEASPGSQTGLIDRIHGTEHPAPVSERNVR